MEKVAPWLTVDGDPYPAVVDGRIVWIVDGYTTSDGYPYSQRTTLGDVTTDTLTEQHPLGDGAAVRPGQLHPQLGEGRRRRLRRHGPPLRVGRPPTRSSRSWEQGVPRHACSPMPTIPPTLLPHLRYPEDLFKVQRNMLAQYHVTTPLEFYSGQDFWKVPSDPTTTGAGAVAQPPYYLSVKMPGQDAAAFSLTTTFAPQKRETLAAFMAVNAEPGPDYGTIRLLRLPAQHDDPGTGAGAEQLRVRPRRSRDLALFRSQGSEVELGNLLTLPVGGGLLYVEPVYIQASGAAGVPVAAQGARRLRRPDRLRRHAGGALAQVLR